MDTITIISLVLNFILFVICVKLNTKSNDKKLQLYQAIKDMLIYATCVNVLTSEKMGAKLDHKDMLEFTAMNANVHHLVTLSNQYWYLSQVKECLDGAETNMLLCPAYTNYMEKEMKKAGIEV